MQGKVCKSEYQHVGTKFAADNGLSSAVGLPDHRCVHARLCLYRRCRVVVYPHTICHQRAAEQAAFLLPVICTMHMGE